MPRRKLGRIQALPPDERTARKYLLRMSGYQLHHEPESLPEITSPDLFGDDGPLELEAGCGSGEFIISLAERDPDANFVGVDLHYKSLFKAVETASEEGLENVKFLAADFRFLYSRLADDSLRAVYLHFPDPGMKNRLRGRRLFDRRFLDEMHRSLLPGGRVSVVSDHEEYFHGMLSLVAEDGRWERTHEEPYLTGFDPPVKSRFQQMWESRGRVPLRFELVRSGDFEEDR
jgi:tRNA (guanine-N7-)-methyltransferase